MQKVKYCRWCKKEKSLDDDFYLHPKMKDGHLNKCKECVKEAVRSDYRAHLDAHKKHELERNKTPARRKNQTKYCKRARRKYPERYKAHTAVANALRNGLFKRMPCEGCGNPDSQAHHDDYSKPLEVRWLCKSHHDEVHREMRKVP
jgi:hypothetical protein